MKANLLSTDLVKYLYYRYYIIIIIIIIIITIIIIIIILERDQQRASPQSSPKINHMLITGLLTCKYESYIYIRVFLNLSYIP